ncbi:MAG: hypothetical protein ACRD8Z_27295, partial [Nitrososphaeraceae archaeon]
MPQRILIFSITVIFAALFVVVICVTITHSSSEIHSTSITGIDKPIGVWGPFSNNDHNLEQLSGINQSRA